MATVFTCLHLFITCLLLHALLAAAQRDEVEDQSAFSYDLDERGPHNWARLNPNWTTCGVGKLQSPIDLVDRRVVSQPTLGNLVRVHKPAPAVIKNRGHDITLKWYGDAGGVVVNRTLYRLKQCHWHTPSEHTVRGRRYPMELHLVHKDSRGRISVVGILYKLGRRDPFLASVLRNNRTVSRNETNLGIVDPLGVKFGSRNYLRYMGSLTTPPCTEGVLWTVLKKVSTVSRRQMRALRTAVQDGFEDNARPIQHYEMPVYMYNPDNAPIS